MSLWARLHARVGLATPAQRAWAWYDSGNSAFFTTIVTAVFPSFFALYAAAGMEGPQATARFGAITTVAMILIAVSAPILGAIADYSASRKRLLTVFMLGGAAACFAMTTIGDGGWRWAALLFIAGNLGVSGSLVFYDSLLPYVARPEETDRVSTAGYAIGYLGGGLLLLLNLAWVMQPAVWGFADATAATKAAFASVGVWWILFTIPLLRHVPEPARVLQHGERGDESVFVAAFGRLGRTFQEIKGYRQAFLLLLAMLVYQDGIQTIIRMAAIYATELGIGQTAQIGAFVIVQFVGVPFSFLFGMLGARIGTKRAIFLALTVYAFACVLGYFMTTAMHFFLLAALIGMVQGGSQALSRSLFARLIPPAKASEYFGFYAVVERFATILGPAVFTVSVLLTGSSRNAILLVILFFVGGAWLLSRVDVEEGERAARGGVA
ncbi:MAG: MFS transporter [Vicinamibacterales bacterium]|nr:MFS transporter [Vicinamibacterales bacterium]